MPSNKVDVPPEVFEVAVDTYRRIKDRNENEQDEANRLAQAADAQALRRFMDTVDKKYGKLSESARRQLQWSMDYQLPRSEDEDAEKSQWYMDHQLPRRKGTDVEWFLGAMRRAVEEFVLTSSGNKGRKARTADNAQADTEALRAAAAILEPVWRQATGRGWSGGGESSGMDARPVEAFLLENLRRIEPLVGLRAIRTILKDWGRKGGREN